MEIKNDNTRSQCFSHRSHSARVRDKAWLVISPCYVCFFLLLLHECFFQKSSSITNQGEGGMGTNVGTMAGVQEAMAFIDKDGRMDIGAAIQDTMQNERVPKKRNIVVTLYLSCLGFLIFCLTLMDALIRELVENDRILNLMEEWRKFRNDTLTTSSTTAHP